jgi:type IV pilus assembly protein PilP
MRVKTALSLVLLICLGCVGDPKRNPAPQPTASASTAEPVPATPTPPAVVAPRFDLDRDPFAQVSGVKNPPAPTNDLARKAKKYSVDQLRLVGIVGGEEQPRAMFIDPRGKGWIVERGDRIGQAELRVDHFTGWRVDKIRADDVVLRREDQTRAPQTEETRVLALHSSPEPLDLDD